MTKNNFKLTNTCIKCGKRIRNNPNKMCKNCYWENVSENAIDPHSLTVRFRIFERDNFTCQYCGRNVKDDKIKIQLDHIVPIKKGGEKKLRNYVTSCYECNKGKGNSIINTNRDTDGYLKLNKGVKK